ncbi:hypothetical protein RRG08_066454 [Elysia crispata]|uniref:Uncharacterized protein n=1 Tax=Elysia crispata TaxID=231223 RepID=A0AAE1DDA4_9GAST|nr:hypothetical protein RRG08_066454 [Elysia crispata]
MLFLLCGSTLHLISKGDQSLPLLHNIQYTHLQKSSVLGINADPIHHRPSSMCPAKAIHKASIHTVIEIRNCLG